MNCKNCGGLLKSNKCEFCCSIDKFESLEGGHTFQIEVDKIIKVGFFKTKTVKEKFNIECGENEGGLFVVIVNNKNIYIQTIRGCNYFNQVCKNFIIDYSYNDHYNNGIASMCLNKYRTELNFGMKSKKLSYDYIKQIVENL